MINLGAEAVPSCGVLEERLQEIFMHLSEDGAAVLTQGAIRFS